MGSGCFRQTIDLRGHDEIVLVQTLDLVGVHRDGHVTPAEMDIRVMAFGFGEFADLDDELHRPFKVREAKGALDAAGIVHERPGGRLREELLRRGSLERWNPAAAGNAGLVGKVCGHSETSRWTAPRTAGSI